MPPSQLRQIYLWRGYHSPEILLRLKDVWESGHLLILCPPQMTDFEFVRYLPLGDIHFVGEWVSLAISARAQITREPSLRRQRDFPSPPVLGVFTSGTLSGKNRLVLYSRENVMCSLKSIRDLFEVDRIKKIFCYPQPTHTFGLTLGYLQAFLFGLELVTPKGRYGREAHQLWLKNANQHTLTLGTPVHFHDLIEESKNFPPISESYSCIVGGAPVTVKLWHEIQSRLKIQSPSIGYGSTEASPGVTHLAPGLPPKTDGEIGPALSQVKLKIIPKQGVEFEGPNVCLSYLSDGAEEQDWVFPRRILLRDELLPSAHGSWIYRGRTDLMINRGGHKISLEQVENHLKKHFPITVACVSVPHPRLGEELGILYQGEATKDDILKSVKERWPLHFDSQFIKKLETLPLTANLKIDRKICQKYFKMGGHGPEVSHPGI